MCGWCRSKGIDQTAEGLAIDATASDRITATRFYITHDSFPNIPFIDQQTIFLTQSPKLILKRFSLQVSDQIRHIDRLIRPTKKMDMILDPADHDRG